MNAVPVRPYPTSEVLDTGELTYQHLAEVASGQLVAVRVPGLLPPRLCDQVVARLATMPMSTYDTRRVDPPIHRFGPVLNDYRHEGALRADYWEHAGQARAAWLATGFDPDPLRQCQDHLSAAWGVEVIPARINRRAVFAGTVREINSGARVHFDQVVHEFPDGLFDQQVVAQLAFNAYLAVPDGGGETTVWRRRWRRQDERFRTSYGYRDDVVADSAAVTISPAKGEGLIFNPGNYHAVAATQAGRRMALAFFLAVTGSGHLMTWS